jgi:hypothetical protein
MCYVKAWTFTTWEVVIPNHNHKQSSYTKKSAEGVDKEMHK